MPRRDCDDLTLRVAAIGQLLALSRCSTSYEMPFSGKLRLDFGPCLSENFGQACVIDVGPDSVMLSIWPDRRSTRTCLPIRASWLVSVFGLAFMRMS